MKRDSIKEKKIQTEKTREKDTNIKISAKRERYKQIKRERKYKQRKRERQ